MKLGVMLVFFYWTTGAAIRELQPKVTQMEKANVFDRKSMNEEIRKCGEKKHRDVKMANAILKALKVIKLILFVLVGAEVLFLLGAIITGSFFVLGYPVW